MRVWIASPQDFRQTPLGEGLHRAHCELTVLGDAEAVERALAGGLPDALLLDGVTLPELAPLLTRLREGGLAPELPVAVVGTGTVEGRVALFDAGADDVVSPEIDARELLARLARRGSRAVVAPAVTGEQAIVDALTEVHNRRYFLVRLAEELRRAQRYDTPLALVVVDLDHFRGINEAAGHLAGDAVLRTVAQCVVGAVRETDTVARIGGDAFACILPQTHLAGALTVAERIRTDVAALRTGPTSELLLTASVGVGTHPAVAVQTPEELIAVADRSLARAKQQGRNRVCLADPGLGGHARTATPPLNPAG